MPLSNIRLDVAAKQKKQKKERERERERIRDEINYGHFCTVVILHFVSEIVTPPALFLPLHLLRINHIACKWYNSFRSYVNHRPAFEKYFVIMEGWMEWVQDCAQLRGFILTTLNICLFLLLHSSLIVYYIKYTQYLFVFVCGVTAPTPPIGMASSFTRFLDHTQWRTMVGRTPLDNWSAHHRDLYLTTHNTHNRQTSMSLAGFEPIISAGEWLQTYALDRTATGTSR